MSSCANCGKAVGSEKHCQACGTPAPPGRRITMDEARFQSLTDAIIQSYASKPPKRRFRFIPKNVGPWLPLAVCLAVAFLAGLLFGRVWQVRSTPPDEAFRVLHPLPSPTPLIVALRSPEPQTRATAKPTASPSPSPEPTPTATPTPSPAPTSTPKTKKPKPPPLTALNASDVVKSNGDLNVGGVGSCEGGDVSIAVGDYPRGCTIFKGAVIGPLAGGVGTALMVPVSTSGSLDDVDYDLLYVRAPDFVQPRFIGILNGDGSGRLAVRLENGFIVEQNGSSVKYSRFDGSRLVSASQSEATP